MAVADIKVLLFTSSSSREEHGSSGFIRLLGHRWRTTFGRILPETSFPGRSWTQEIHGTIHYLSGPEILRFIDDYSTSSSFAETHELAWVQLKSLSRTLQIGSPPVVHPKVKIQGLEFGTFISPRHFQQHFSPTFREMEVEFQHDCFPGILNIFFTANQVSPGESTVHRLEISYSSVVRILISGRDFYLWLKNPGRMFRAKPWRGPLTRLEEVNPRSAWIRSVCPPEWDESVTGMCDVVKFRIPSTSIPQDTFVEILAQIQRRGNIPLFWTPVGRENAGKGNIMQMMSVDFASFFAWQCFLSRGFQVTGRLTREFQTAVEEGFLRVDPCRAAKSLYSITNLIDRNLWFDFLDGFSHFMNFYGRNPRLLTEERIPNYKYVRRAIKTPTRLLFLQPEIMHENRILRRYDPDFALRLCFRDENISDRLSSGFLQVDSQLYERTIVDVLNGGIPLMDRDFQFLGWSNSQMKDHCVWLYAEDGEGETAEKIRSESGDFSHIRSVPKFCARWAQCMTQTEESLSMEVSVEREVVRMERDIKDPSGRYTFSDGVGRISRGLVEEVCLSIRSVRNQRRLIPPSAYQIRYGGCKGMLALDPLLEGNRIVFRDSQKKFDLKDRNPRTLEIAKYSQPSKVSLNRPMISILEHLRARIPHGQDVFHSLQEKHLMAMSEMLLYEKEALHQLRAKISQLQLFYTSLDNSGIPFTTEPFFRHLMLAVNRKVNANLAQKARIEIPHEYGRNLLGVMDETGELRYGQVFLQYSDFFDRPRETTTVLQGKVVVTKNPCMHPGDVRVFTAVDVPGLHHMVDVIVFPQHGHRPHPDEMAGSDLDGDEYQAIWLREMIFHRNEPPMDYPAAQTLQNHSTEIKGCHMIQWFRDFVEKDQVGLISSAHMAHADLLGVDSPLCLSLVAKHSMAVDFQKTGVGASLLPEERVSTYPDFMGKRYRTHRSQRILGQLYRKAIRVETLSQSSIRCKPPITLDPTLLHAHWKEYREEAARDMETYFVRIQDLMSQYGIDNESELVSGHIMRMRMVLMERSELFDVEKILKIHMKNLQKKSREIFLEEFGGGDIDIHPFTDLDSDQLPETNLMSVSGMTYQRMLATASAYYAVTYNTEWNQSGLLSFPWVVVGDLLVRVKHGSTRKHSAPLSLSLQTAMRKHVRDNPRSGNLDRLNHRLQSMIRASKPYLSVLLKILLRWAERTERGRVFRPGGVTPDVLCALVMKFCSSREDTEEVGLLCLKLIQFWGSQKFRNDGEVLPEFYRAGIVQTEHYHHGRIMQLHFAAFNTFHRVSITGRFDGLFLRKEDTSPEEEAPSFDVEVFPRFVLELTSSDHAACFGAVGGRGYELDLDDLFWGLHGIDSDVSVDDKKAAALIADKLKEATGMSEISIRTNKSNRNHYRWEVSGTGSMEARDSLRGILVGNHVRALLTGGGTAENLLEEM